MSHKFKTQLSICFETLQTPLWPLKPSCFLPLLRLIHMTTWNHSFLRNPSVSTYNKGKPIGTRWSSHILHLHSNSLPVTFTGGTSCPVTAPTQFYKHICAFYIHSPVRILLLPSKTPPLRSPSRSSKSTPLLSLL